MERPARKPSIFSEKLDRTALTAYFLGAVVPLVALAFVVERYALPTLEDARASYGLLALVASIAVLSLGSFLVLRLHARRSLLRMDRDNRRLSGLLDVSSRLASAQHLNDATRTAAKSAVRLAEARAACVVLRGEGEEAKPVLVEAAGTHAAKLFRSLDAPIMALAELVISEGRPALRGPSPDTAGGVPGFAAAVVPLPGDTGVVGALVVVRTDPPTAFDPDEVGALSTLAALSSVAVRNADLRDAQRNFFSHVIEMLVSALDAHLGFNRGHCNHVAQMANRVGRALEIDEAQLQQLHFAALLHDIGMLKLDRRHQMSSKTCEKHPVIGYRMLKRIRLWRDLAPIVHHHHECFDGSGYPEGLAGDAIPLLSRIIGIAEAFDAMTNPDSYQPAMALEEARAEILRCAGTQFDPVIAETFVRLIDEGVIEPAG